MEVNENTDNYGIPLLNWYLPSKGKESENILNSEDNNNEKETNINDKKLSDPYSSTVEDKNQQKNISAQPQSNLIYSDHIGSTVSYEQTHEFDEFTSKLQNASIMNKSVTQGTAEINPGSYNLRERKVKKNYSESNVIQTYQQQLQRKRGRKRKLMPEFFPNKKICLKRPKKPSLIKNETQAEWKSYGGESSTETIRMAIIESETILCKISLIFKSSVKGMSKPSKRNEALALLETVKRIIKQLLCVKEKIKTSKRTVQKRLLQNNVNKLIKKTKNLLEQLIEIIVECDIKQGSLDHDIEDINQLLPKIVLTDQPFITCNKDKKPKKSKRTNIAKERSLKKVTDSKLITNVDEGYTTSQQSLHSSRAEEAFNVENESLISNFEDILTISTGDKYESANRRHSIFYDGIKDHIHINHKILSKSGASSGSQSGTSPNYFVHSIPQPLNDSSQNKRSFLISKNTSNDDTFLQKTGNIIKQQTFADGNVSRKILRNIREPELNLFLQGEHSHTHYEVQNNSSNPKETLVFPQTSFMQSTDTEQLNLNIQNLKINKDTKNQAKSSTIYNIENNIEHPGTLNIYSGLNAKVDINNSENSLGLKCNNNAYIEKCHISCDSKQPAQEVNDFIQALSDISNQKNSTKAKENSKLTFQQPLVGVFPLLTPTVKNTSQDQKDKIIRYQSECQKSDDAENCSHTMTVPIELTAQNRSVNAANIQPSVNKQATKKQTTLYKKQSFKKKLTINVKKPDLSIQSQEFKILSIEKAQGGAYSRDLDYAEVPSINFNNNQHNGNLKVKNFKKYQRKPIKRETNCSCGSIQSSNNTKTGQMPNNDIITSDNALNMTTEEFLLNNESFQETKVNVSNKVDMSGKWKHDDHDKNVDFHLEEESSCTNQTSKKDPILLNNIPDVKIADEIKGPKTSSYDQRLISFFESEDIDLTSNVNICQITQNKYTDINNTLDSACNTSLSQLTKKYKMKDQETQTHLNNSPVNSVENCNARDIQSIIEGIKTVKLKSIKDFVVVKDLSDLITADEFN